MNQCVKWIKKSEISEIYILQLKITNSIHNVHNEECYFHKKNDIYLFSSPTFERSKHRNYIQAYMNYQIELFDKSI